MTFKRKKFVLDVLLNIIASYLPLMFLHMAVNPFFAQHMLPDEYGQMLVVISIMTMLISAFGGSLHNVRLLLDLKYCENELSGDFNMVLLFLICLASVLSVLVVFFYRFGYDYLALALFSLIVVVGIMREYFIVSFRLRLNFGMIALSSAILMAGYYLGYLFFTKSGKWELVYIIGYSFSTIFIITHSSLPKEPFMKTKFFWDTAHTTAILLVSNFLSSTAFYIDKLLLFPVIGGTLVSVYYTATLLGKIIMMGISPLNSVMLSYFAKMKTLTVKVFISILGFATVVGLAGYLICITISRPVLTFLYPLWADEAMQYIHITTATAVIAMLCGVLSPMVLKFRSTVWQIIVHGVNLFAFVFISLMLLFNYGLMGFCIGALICGIIKLIMLLLIYIKSNGEIQIGQE